VRNRSRRIDDSPNPFIFGRSFGAIDAGQAIGRATGREITNPDVRGEESYVTGLLRA
jgi:hypothetical protein